MPLRQSRLKINLDNLIFNYKMLQSIQSKLMPVIKANAYGHGLLQVGKALAEEGADWLAVGTVAEAVRLRQNQYRGKIVALLGVMQDADLEAARAYQIIPLIHDWPGLTRWQDFMVGLESNQAQPVALKCNSGMNRLGFSKEDLGAVADFIKAAGTLQPEILLSHLACADDPKEDLFTQAQAQSFEACLSVLRLRFPNILSSLANSAGLLAFPSLAGELARPGLALYGANPLEGSSRAALGQALRPVMELSVPILALRDLAPDESLGYGRSYKAQSRRRIAVVALGYADGYRRNPKADSAMTVHGQRAALLGRVSMQMSCLDVSDIPEVKVGDWAYILGGPGQAISAGQVASYWDTIAYEVFCLLGLPSED